MVLMTVFTAYFDQTQCLQSGLFLEKMECLHSRFERAGHFSVKMLYCMDLGAHHGGVLPLQNDWLLKTAMRHRRTLQAASFTVHSIGLI